MKATLSVICSVLVFTWVSVAQAETQYGFKGIPFGTKYSEARKKIKTFKDRDGNHYKHTIIKDANIKNCMSDTIELHHFEVGSKNCTIIFYFNHPDLQF